MSKVQYASTSVPFIPLLPSGMPCHEPLGLIGAQDSNGWRSPWTLETGNVLRLCSTKTGRPAAFFDGAALRVCHNQKNHINSVAGPMSLSGQLCGRPLLPSSLVKLLSSSWSKSSVDLGSNPRDAPHWFRSRWRACWWIEERSCTPRMLDSLSWLLEFLPSTSPPFSPSPTSFLTQIVPHTIRFWVCPLVDLHLLKHSKASQSGPGLVGGGPLRASPRAGRVVPRELPGKPRSKLWRVSNSCEGHLRRKEPGLLPEQFSRSKNGFLSTPRA